MPSTYKTRGIILRSISYGETSIIVTIYTRVFGIQSYIVNGVRSVKKGSSKAALYQPASILDLEVYHNELKALNRIKEASWTYVYQENFTAVIKNCICLFMVELLHKVLKQPEPNEDLFDFTEDALVQLDKAEPAVAANFPLYFSLHLTDFLGLKISDVPREINPGDTFYLDLAEGKFVTTTPHHNFFLQDDEALNTSILLKTMQPSELKYITLNQQKRRALIDRYMQFYSIHIPDFAGIKTLKVLYELHS